MTNEWNRSNPYSNRSMKNETIMKMKADSKKSNLNPNFVSSIDNGSTTLRTNKQSLNNSKPEDDNHSSTKNKFRSRSLLTEMQISELLSTCELGLVRFFYYI